jgi:hypothetical protein
MKTLEDQIRDYAGFVADETHTYEVHVRELRSAGQRTMGGRGVSIPPPAQSNGVGQPAGKKRKLTLALVALLGAGTVSGLGVARQMAAGPQPQQVRFVPLSATEIGHYAPAHMPENFSLKRIQKLILPAEAPTRLVVLGRVKPDGNIADAVMASQFSVEPPEQNTGETRERLNLDGRSVLFVTEKYATGADQVTEIPSASMALPGCGFLSLFSFDITDKTALAHQAENFSCRDGKLAGRAPKGSELLYDAPWAVGNDEEYSFDYRNPDGGQFVLHQQMNLFPKEFQVLFDRLGSSLDQGPRQNLGGQSVRTYRDPMSGFTTYSWRQAEAALALNVSPGLSQTEIGLVIASFRKLTDEEWNAIIAEHQPEVYNNGVLPTSVPSVSVATSTVG